MCLSIAPLVSQALLHAPGTAEPLLPWAARLCLLHACLATGNAGARRWRWLPGVADSASSLALQEIATKSGSGGGGRVGSNGKGRARAHRPKETGKRAAGSSTEAFSAALMAQVCKELAAAGLAGPDTASRSSFLSSFRDTAPGVAGNGLSSGCAAGLLPGGHVSAAFRLKLQSLRDALLCGTEGEGEAVEQPAPSAVVTAIARIGLENLEIHPETVRRALERGRCGGEAFILAVQVTTMHCLLPRVRCLCWGWFLCGYKALLQTQVSFAAEHPLRWVVGAPFENIWELLLGMVPWCSLWILGLLLRSPWDRLPLHPSATARAGS